MRAWSPLYFANAPIYHVMTSYDNLLQFMTHINIDQLSGALFTGLKRHPGQCQFDLYFQSTVQRHHKWKEASQVEGGITSGRRHHKWKDT